MATGEELPGASLELKTVDGTVIDSWISGKTPHFVDGTLTAGETYILTEISAPDGYEIADSIKFTVPIDGSFIKIEMTDRRKTLDEPERPTEPELPNLRQRRQRRLRQRRRNQRRLRDRQSRNSQQRPLRMTNRRNRWRQSGQNRNRRRNRNKNGTEKRRMAGLRYAMSGNFPAAQRGESVRRTGQVSGPRRLAIPGDRKLRYLVCLSDSLVFGICI